jgi:hypothetical protein
MHLLIKTTVTSNQLFIYLFIYLLIYIAVYWWEDLTFSFFFFFFQPGNFLIYELKSPIVGWFIDPPYLKKKRTVLRT